MQIFSVLWCSMLIALPASATAQCILSGPATIDRVRIEPRGAPAFDLGLVEYDSSVSPLGSGRVRVVSATALVWSGVAREGDVQAWTARTVALAGDALTLGRGVEVAGLRLPDHGEPFADVKLEEGVWIRGATIPCDALSLGETELDPAPAEGPESGEVVARVARVRVYEQPGGRSAIVDVASGTELRLALVEVRDGWIRVRRDYDAARIDGWVRTSDVRIVASAPFSRPSSGRHGGGGCGHGASHTYIGPATLLAGTELRTAAEDGAVWAIASTDMEVTVAFRWGAEWGQVEGIPGLLSPDAQCGHVLENAWVPQSGVRLPSGQPPP